MTTNSGRMFHVIGNQGYYTPLSSATRLSSVLRNEEDTPSSTHSRSARSSRSTRSYHTHTTGNSSYHSRSTLHRSRIGRHRSSHTLSDNNSSRGSRSCHARPESARVSGNPNDVALFSPGRTRTRLNWDHQTNTSPTRVKRCDIASSRKSRTRLSTTGLLVELTDSPRLAGDLGDSISSLHDASNDKYRQGRQPDSLLSPSSSKNANIHKLGQQQCDQLQDQLFRKSSKKNKKATVKTGGHQQPTTFGQSSPSRYMSKLKQHLSNSQPIPGQYSLCDASTNTTSSITAADELETTQDSKIDLEESISSMAMELERRSHESRKSLTVDRHGSVDQHSQDRQSIRVEDLLLPGKIDLPESDELQDSHKQMSCSFDLKSTQEQNVTKSLMDVALTYNESKKSTTANVNSRRTASISVLASGSNTRSVATEVQDYDAVCGTNNVGVARPTAFSVSDNKLDGLRKLDNMQGRNLGQEQSESNHDIPVDPFSSDSAKVIGQRCRGGALWQDSVNSLSEEQPQSQHAKQQTEHARRRGGIRTTPIGKNTRSAAPAVDTEFNSSSSRRGALLEASLSNLVAAALSEASGDDEAEVHRNTEETENLPIPLDGRDVALAAARAAACSRRGALTQDSISMLDLENSTRSDRRGALVGGSASSLAASAAALVHAEEHSSLSSMPRNSADASIGAVAKELWQRRQSDDSVSLGELLDDDNIDDLVDPTAQTVDHKSAENSESSSAHKRRGALLGQSTSSIVATAAGQVNSEECKLKSPSKQSTEDSRSLRSPHSPSRRGALKVSFAANSGQNSGDYSSAVSAACLSDRRGALLSASSSSLIATAVAEANAEDLAMHHSLSILDPYQRANPLPTEQGYGLSNFNQSCDMSRLVSSRRGGLVLVSESNSAGVSLSKSALFDRRGALLGGSASSVIAVAAAQAQDETIQG